MKWTGRVLLWLFAAWGVFVSGALIVFWAKSNVPWAGCYVENQKLAPGSGPYKAAQIVLARAKQKYPEIDFSKRRPIVINLEDPVYFNGEEMDVWIVAYSETVTNAFGCHKGFRGRGVQGNVGKNDFRLRGDVLYSAD